jgi:hypothetical protein
MNKLATETSRRTLLRTAGAIIIAPAARSANAEISLATAINRCARFRALPQRCAKLYTQMTLNVLPDKSGATLATALRLIQAGFDELAAGKYSADVAQQIALTKSSAASLTAMAASTPKRDAVAAVSAEADKMTAQAIKATDMLTTYAKSGSAKIIDTAGKQRFLSQRIAKNYFLMATGLNASSIRSQMLADRTEFKAAITAMQNAPISTSLIRGDLELLNGQWVMFESAIDKMPDRLNAMEDVATSSERLLEVANSLTNRYEAALSELLGKT